MTLAIPPRQVQLYRLLWTRWIIVLRVLFDLGAGAHPVRWNAVANTLLIDKGTAQKYIQGLVRDGHAVSAGEGFMLTEAGMSFLQDVEGGEKFPLEGKNRGENLSLLKEVVVVVDSDSELKQLTTPPPSKLGKNPAENFSPLVTLAFESIPDLFGGAQIFTKGLLPNNDVFIDESLFLGWLAYVYDHRTSATSPVGLLYSKLKMDERPPMGYAKRYVDYLPEWFLERLGLVEYTCGWCPETFATRDEKNAHEQAAHPHRCMECNAAFATEDEVRSHYHAKHDPYIDRRSIPKDVVAQRDGPAGEAWSKVLMKLQEDMPRASFDTWVRDTVAVRLSDGTLTVASRNQYARDWLENRLTGTVSLLLAGILQQPVDVTFIVATETES